VISALQSIKLSKLAGATEIPVLDPTVSQGLLFQYVPGKNFAPLFLFSNPVLCTSAPVPKANKHWEGPLQPCTRGRQREQVPMMLPATDSVARPGLSHEERGERTGWCLHLPPGNCPWLPRALTVGNGQVNKHILHLTWRSRQRGFVVQSKPASVCHQRIKDAGSQAGCGARTVALEETAVCLGDCNKPAFPKHFVLAALPHRHRAGDEEPQGVQ